MLHLPYDECREIEATHCCAECKMPLVTVWAGPYKEFLIRCSTDTSHRGFERLLKEDQKRGFSDRLRDQVTTEFEGAEEAKMRESKPTLEGGEGEEEE